MAKVDDHNRFSGVHTPASLMPLMPLTVAVGVGMWLVWLAVPGVLGALVAGGCVVICGVLGMPYRLAVFCIGVGVGCLLGVAARPNPCPVNDEGRYYCSAVIESVKEQSRGQRLLLTVDSIGRRAVTPFKAVAINDASENVLKSGYRMRFIAELVKPTPVIDYPDQVDYDSITLAQGVVAKTFLTSESVKSIMPARGVLQALKRQRDVLKQRLAQLDINYLTWTFLCATVAGDSSSLDVDDREQFARAGLAHLLALSGLHVGILAGLGGLLLLPLRLLVGRRWQSVILLVLIWAYAAVTGMSVSVVRASLMISVVLLAIVFDLRSSSLNSLCVSALIIAVADPSQVYTVGFALTFMAVLGVILFDGMIRLPNNAPRAVRYLSGIIVASVGATTFTAPVVTCCFHTFPLAFLPANLMAAPLLGVIMILVVVMLLFAMFGLQLSWGGECLDLLCAWIRRVSQTVSGWEWACVDALYPHPFTPWVIMCVIAAFLLWMRKPRRRYIVLSVSAMLVCVICETSQPALAREGEYFLRHAGRTEMLIHRGDTLWLWTNAGGLASQQALSENMREARHFMARRDIKAFRLLPDTCELDGITCRGSLLEIDGVKYWFDAGTVQDKDVPNDTVNCYVACRNGRKDVVGAVETMHADSVILSYDLIPRKKQRLINELKQKGVPYRVM